MTRSGERRGRKRFKPSPEYVRMLEYISESPRLLSVLYDMNLMSETVSDTEKVTTRHAMMAAVIAYAVGAGEDDWKNTQRTIDRLSHG